MKTIAFFGHRKLFNKNKIKEKVFEKLKEVIPQGFSRVLVGCHGDFDNIALSVSLNYKEKFDQNLEICIVLTSLTYLTKDENGYSCADIYKEKGCETIFYDIEETYFKNKIIVSNKKMVNDSDLIICYVDMKSYKSGAKIAINYALKQNKKIINIFKEE
ncbi:MAG: hypothetical protein J6A99_01520 [Clostridia bacterium]|nr:hypothetical protein [Clostridia bacterium]